MKKNVVYYSIDKTYPNYVDYVTKRIDGHLEVKAKHFENEKQAIDFTKELENRKTK